MNAFLEAHASGMTIEAAAEVAGIHKRTHYNWIEKGKKARKDAKEGSPYAQYLNRYEQTIERRVDVILDTISDFSLNKNITRVVKHKKDAEGNVIETIEIETRKRQDWRMMFQMLQTLDPERFGKDKIGLENVTPPGVWTDEQRKQAQEDYKKRERGEHKW